ncbi:MAG: hypothetical protein AB2669_00540 [Candidatus Thiodiazotropha endolucinida]
MKIRFDGIITTAELRQLLYQAVTEIEGLGIREMRGCNLYFTAVDKNGRPVSPRLHDKSISELTVDGPYKSAADDFGL